MKLLILSCCFFLGVHGDPLVEGQLGRITGKIQQVLDLNIESFLGIPYAKPPLGDLRFALPKAFGAVGDLEATAYGPSCMQPNDGPLAPKNRPLSEDCLTLNIFRKEGTSKSDKKAVIATLHGGGFLAGSASDPVQNAASLAGVGDVIVVSLNYRLGILGFADMKEFAPGNLGLYDQRLALQWIQDHIEDFGGDPEQVTVMGVSAGSMSVAAQIMTPIDDRNLFRSVVMDAGVVLCNGFHEDSDSSYARLKKIARQIGCPVDSMEMVACLRKVEAETLLSFAMNTTGDSGILYFVATTDGIFIPRDVRNYVKNNSASLRKVRAIIGYAKNEGSLFVSSSFMAKDYPSPKSRNELMEYLKTLSRNYDYPLDFTENSTKELISGLYVERYPDSYLQAIVAFQSDGIFKCAINDFIESYSQFSDEVYVYHFERRFKATYGRILNPDVLGAFHLSPYLHFSGALFLGSKPVHPEDRVFVLDTMGMIAAFAKSSGLPTLRGVEWPRYGKSGTILMLDESPSLSKGLPSEGNCRQLFTAHEKPSTPKSKAEL